MMNIKNELEKVLGKDFRTDVVKVKIFKGYWLQGKIVGLEGDMLTVEIPTHYYPMIETVKVNVNEVIKIKKETK